MTIRSANVSVPPLTPHSLVPKISIRHRHKERSPDAFEIGPEGGEEESRPKGEGPGRGDFARTLIRFPGVKLP